MKGAIPSLFFFFWRQRGRFLKREREWRVVQRNGNGNMSVGNVSDSMLTLARTTRTRTRPAAGWRRFGLDASGAGLDVAPDL